MPDAWQAQVQRASRVPALALALVPEVVSVAQVPLPPASCVLAVPSGSRRICHTWVGFACRTWDNSTINLQVVSHAPPAWACLRVQKIVRGRHVFA